MSADHRKGEDGLAMFFSYIHLSLPLVYQTKRRREAVACYPPPLPLGAAFFIQTNRG